MPYQQGTQLASHTRQAALDEGQDVSNGLVDAASDVGMDALRSHIAASISRHLPEAIEYQRFGYNMLFQKTADIDGLQRKLRSMLKNELRQPLRQMLESLRNPVEAFLDKFKLFRHAKGLHTPSLDFINLKLSLNKEGWDERVWEYEIIAQANRLTGYLSETLALIQALADRPEYASSWQEFEGAISVEQRNELLPINTDRHAGDYANAKTRANLSGNNPENIKFNRIVTSLTWEERKTREALSATLTGRVPVLMSGIALTKKAAKEAHKQSRAAGLAENLLDVCNVLKEVFEVIENQERVIRPSASELATSFKQPEHDGPETFTGLPRDAERYLEASAKTITQKALVAKNVLGLGIDKTFKNKHRAAHYLSAFPGRKTVEATRKTHEMILQAGITLLDRVQQTQAALGKVRKAALPLQQAVQWADSLSDDLSNVGTDASLDEKLQLEANRWQEQAVREKVQLQDTLETFTPLTRLRSKQAYLMHLKLFLRHAPDASLATVSAFDTRIRDVVEVLADIEGELKIQTMRLSEHGRAGGEDLDQCMANWYQRLTKAKSQLKTSITEATGQSMNNFSRDGMLARRVGEWSTAEKQRYLADFSDEQRAVVETQYDRLFLDMIEDHLPLLSSDPEKQDLGLLQHLRIQLGNASRGTTLYPENMAEIIAGMKSTDEALKDWSRRRLVRRVLLTLCLQPMKFGINLAAIPIKLVIAGARVGLGVRKGHHGIRAGDARPNDEMQAYAKRSFGTSLIKLVLSLPPFLAEVIGATTIAIDVYEGGLEGAMKKIGEALLTETPWIPSQVGFRMAAQRVIDKRSAVNEASAQFDALIQHMLDDAQAEQLDQLDEYVAGNTLEASSPVAGEGETLTRLSTKDHLKRMAESDDPALRSLALCLQKQLGGDEVPLWQSNLSGRSYYSKSGHWVVLSADASDWTIMHEIVHSLTARQLAYGLLYPASRLGELALQIDDLRERAKAAYKGSDPFMRHYLSNVEEFVAGLYSGNHDFSELLSSIDSENGGLISLVTELVAWLLGLPAEQESALSKAMQLSGEVMNSPTPSIEESNAPDGIHTKNDKLFSAPPRHSAPGWRRVGKINNSDKSVPAGKSVTLSFVKKDGSEFQTVIEIPLGHRGASAWQAYVADYVSRFKAWPERLRAGEVNANGQIIPVGSSFRNEILVEDSSAVESVSWSFTEDRAAAPVSAHVPGSDMSFPVLDDFNRKLHRYGKSLDRREVLKKNLAAKKEALRKTKASSWWENDFIDALQEEIDEVWEKIKELNISIPADKAALDALDRQATAERILVGIMSSRVESVKPLGYAELDEHNLAASTHALMLKQWEALRAYKEQFHAEAAISSRFQELTAEENKLLRSMDENQRVLDSTKDLARGQQRQWAGAGTKKIRIEREKKEHMDVLRLYARLNKVNAKLKNAALWAQYLKRGTAEEHRLPQVFDRTNSPAHLIKERDEAQKAIDELRARPEPVENNDDLPEQQTSEPSPAAINVEPAFTMTKAELDAMEKKGIADLDEWLIAAAKAGGLTITKKDLDTPISFFMKSQTTGGPNRGQPSTRARPMTLRQILLGEADRLAENGLLISTSLHDFRGARQPINAFLENRVNRSNVADNVMANVTASIKSGFDEIHIQKGFEEAAKASVAFTLMRNFAQLKNENSVYLSIIQNFFLGHSQPSAVYVKGKIVPGLIAIGGGDFRIIISLEKKTFKVFNALSVNVELASFIKDHIAPVERPNIEENDLYQITSGFGSAFDTQPSRVEFKTTHSLYRDLLNASADKMLSNLGSLILTSDEASARTGQNMMKDLAQLTAIAAALATGGASLGVQIAVSAAVGIGASLAEIYIDNKIATTADRAEDRENALNDVYKGKLFLAISVLAEFTGLIKAARNFDDLSDALTRVADKGKRQATGHSASRGSGSPSGSGHSSGYGYSIDGVSDVTVSTQSTPVRTGSPPDTPRMPERPASSTSVSLSPTRGSTAASLDSGFSTPSSSISAPHRLELQKRIENAKKQAKSMLDTAKKIAIAEPDLTKKLGQALSGWSRGDVGTLENQWKNFHHTALPANKKRVSAIKPADLDYRPSLDGPEHVVKRPSTSPNRLEVSEEGMNDLKARGEPAVSDANLSRSITGSVADPASGQLPNQVRTLADGSLDLTEMGLQSMARPRAAGGVQLETDSVMAQILSAHQDNPALLEEFLRRYERWKAQFAHLEYSPSRWNGRRALIKKANPELSDLELDKMTEASALAELRAHAETIQQRLIYGGTGEPWQRTQSGIEKALTNGLAPPRSQIGPQGDRDAVFDLQMENALISPTQHGALRALPDGASVSDVLGSQAKTVRSVEDLKNMTPGYALVLVGEDGQVAHTLINKGKGHVAGLNTEALGGSQPGFASIDLGASAVTPEGQWTINGKPYTLRAQASTPEFRLEPIKPSVAPAGPITLSDMDGHLVDFRNNAAVKKLLEKPLGSCKEVMVLLKDYLEQRGFTNFRYRGMHVYSRLPDPTKPANHFVLIARAPGSTEDYAFDLTSGQFAQTTPNLVVTENNWRIKFAEDMANTNKVVKYQDFKSPERANTRYSAMEDRPPQTFEEGEYVLATPEWYKKTKGPGNAS